MKLETLITLVRLNLKDLAEKNRINAEEFEYADDDISGAANLTLLEINERGIIKFSYTMENCPEYLLILGTSAKVLSSEISLKSRNFVNLSDGGVGVNREGNISLYQNMYQELRADYLDQLEAHKGYMNIKRCLN